MAKKDTRKDHPSNSTRRDQFARKPRAVHPRDMDVHEDTPLTELDIRFKQEYMLRLNATRAYLAVRPDVAYTTASAQGYRLLAKPNVKKAIEAELADIKARFDAKKERIIEELCRITLFDPHDLYDEQGKLLEIRKMPPHVRACLAAFDVEERQDDLGLAITRKLRFSDKIKAAQVLSQLISAGAPAPGDPNTVTHFHTQIPFTKIREKAGKK